MTTDKAAAVPANRRVFDAPGTRVKPRRPAAKAGNAPRLLTQAELEAGVPCPLDHTPNEETIAAFEEGDAMLRGDIPAIRFDSPEEMFRYLKG